jgi:hypothetical protein
MSYLQWTCLKLTAGFFGSEIERESSHSLALEVTPRRTRNASVCYIDQVGFRGTELISCLKAACRVYATVKSSREHTDKKLDQHALDSKDPLDEGRGASSRLTFISVH